MKKRPLLSTRPILPQQQRQPQQKRLDIKDEAVKKATELLELLNSEVLPTITQLEEQKQTSHQLQRLLDAQRELVRTYQDRQHEFRQAAHIREELSGFRATIERKDQEHRQLSEKNRELHLKISQLMDKQKQLSSSLENERIKYASLHNQNEYLIRQYSEFKQRQKQLQTSFQEKEQEIRKEITEIVSVKNAMAGRIEELRKENNSLMIRITKAEAQSKPPPVPAADPFSLLSESDLFKGLIDQLKIENEMLKKQVVELNRRLLNQENRYVLEQLELSRQLNETKKYSYEEHLFIQEGMDQLFRRLNLTADASTLSGRFSQLTDFLSKHLEYFLYVVVRICCKYLDERLSHPPLGWIGNIKEAVTLSERLLHKLSIY